MKSCHSVIARETSKHRLSDLVELIEPKRSPRAARTHRLWTTTNDEGNLRIAVRFQDRAFTKVEEGLINDALTSISTYVEGCIDFVDDTDTKQYSPYIFIRRYDSDNNYDSGCWSYVGNISPYSQSLNLGYGCMNKRIIQHEFLHALGFFHEHTRPDRDNYITGNGFEPSHRINFTSKTTFLKLNALIYNHEKLTRAMSRRITLTTTTR